MKLIFSALVLVLLVGCAMDLPKIPELGFNWESKEGKSGDQLYKDEAECRRDVMMLQPAITGPGGVGWGAGEMRAFDECMQSKGWIKR